MQEILAMKLARETCRLPAMSTKAAQATEKTDTKGDKERPLQLQGNALRAARGSRTVSLIVSEIIDPETGNALSVGRYQHWERGLNAPKRVLWDALSKKLGIDVGALYTQGEASEAIKIASLKPILANLRRNLDLLDALIAHAPTDKHMEDLGYKKMGPPAKMKGSPAKKRRAVSG